MRALAHPIRLALLEALGLRGPLTATQAGELIGESATTCSFHLRQLAKYGLVEEAGGGPGRQRPWRLAYSRLTIDTRDEGHPESLLAAQALDRMFHDRSFQRLQTWYEMRHTFPTSWQNAAGSSQSVLWVTPDELQALQADVTALLARFDERRFDPAQRPADALLAEVLYFSYPLPPRSQGDN